MASCELWSFLHATFQTELFPGERWSSHVIWAPFLKLCYKHERGTPLFFRCNCFRRFFRIVSSIQASRVRVSGPTQHRKLTSWYAIPVLSEYYRLSAWGIHVLALPLITIFNPTFRFWKVLQSKASVESFTRYTCSSHLSQHTFLKAFMSLN